MVKHLLSLADYEPEEVNKIINKAIEIKKSPEKFNSILKNKTLLMIFEKPSLRTRVSFETAMTQMGGHAIFYDVSTSPMGKKETLSDTAKTASRYVDIIMARLLKFKDLKEMADNSVVPVIDALSELNHPCQILGDLQTILEKKGKLKGLTLAYVGDCENNVTYSLLHGCALVGMNIKLGFPENMKPKQEIVEEAEKIAGKTGSKIELFNDPIGTVKDADIVVTDSWMSYHISPEKEKERIKLLEPFKVTSDLMKNAKNDAIFMHCLPANRDQEVSADVIDGLQSVVFDEAENRLHIQKSIILFLMESINNE